VIQRFRHRQCDRLFGVGRSSLQNRDKQYIIVLDRLDYLETVVSIQRGLTELAEGQAVTAIDALEKRQEKLKQSTRA
jgi:hypothetical protein